MKRFAFLTGLVLFLALPASQATAQISVGPQIVVWDFDELGIGARMDYELGETLGLEEGVFQDLFATVNANYVLISDITMLLFNANAAVPFDIDATVTPYAGAGLNHLRQSFDNGSLSWTGLNILGGVFFDLGTLPAFAELQYSTSANGFLSLSAGVLFEF